ncbi:fungal-specific transcription factor domain-containing protein [Cadophora sp. MPI-SDFR-AT-0126]|nr:fungal-specific transcription factor domain-containing protein [Leotiomycetes sp. MPI-SDFR-AT-0126]
MNLSATSGHDDYSNNPGFIESQKEFRTLLFDTARSAGPTRVGSAVDHEENLSRADPEKTTPTSSSYIKTVVTTGERVLWLQNYINEVAPWLDMFDAQQAFGRKVPMLAKTSAPLTYAILAISARQMERQKKLQGEHNSLQLYHEAITSLTPQLQARDPSILAACVILCCLEMMSAAPRNWRKHLDGCAALFESHGIHGFVTGIPQAVFWCYARMDLCASIMSEGKQSSVLALESWLPPNVMPSQGGDLFRSSASADMYANYAVWLCARVCHLAWTRRRNHSVPQYESNSEPFIHRWHSLWVEVQEWAQNRPEEMREFDFVVSENTQRDVFPFILFAAPCAISSNQLYHTSCLLLLDMKPPSITLGNVGQLSSGLWHARRICGISMTNSHHGCLNNAIQPLWVAGKLLSHPTEHRLIVDLIKQIEVETGWSGTWRLRDLRDLWGYDKEDLPL